MQWGSSIWSCYLSCYVSNCSLLLCYSFLTYHVFLLFHFMCFISFCVFVLTILVMTLEITICIFITFLFPTHPSCYYCHIVYFCIYFKPIIHGICFSFKKSIILTHFEKIVFCTYNHISIYIVSLSFLEPCLNLKWSPFSLKNIIS